MRLIWVHMFWFGVALTTDGRGSRGLLWDAACLLQAQASYLEKKRKKEKKKGIKRNPLRCHDSVRFFCFVLLVFWF